MKKLLFISILLLFSINAFAGCSYVYNKAIKYHNKALDYDAKSTDARLGLYLTVWVENTATARAMRKQERCENLLKMRKNSWLAAKNWKKAKKYWRKAYNQCYAENERNAMKNKEEAQDHLEVQINILEQFEDGSTLNEACGSYKPLPDL